MLRPRGVDVHYEVELGLVMGKTVRDLDAGDAKGAVGAVGGMYLIFLFGDVIYCNLIPLQATFSPST